MSRETKQDRIVRNMLDQATEHLHELKALSANPATKELDLERWCQSIVRNCLGFTPSSGYTIRSQESRGKLRPDLLLCKDDKLICVIEVKKLGYDLNKSDLRSGKLQLAEYLHSLGNVPWGILSNGYQWKLFDFSNQTTGGIELISFDIRGENDEIDVTKRSIEEVCWNFVDLHEATFSAGSWGDFSREATAFSPESLSKAILSLDTVRYIARVIRGEHDYRANVEVLFDKLQNILELGLDDAIPGWNETKQAEIAKYVTSQKRAGRRKRANKEAKQEVALEEVATSPSTEVSAPALSSTEGQEIVLSASVTESDPGKKVA